MSWTDEDHGPGCDGPLNCTCGGPPPRDDVPGTLKLLAFSVLIAATVVAAALAWR